jgi:hypothetical protein
MRAFTYKILAIILSQLVLFSTTSFAVDIHKCSGTIYDVSFTGHAKHCDMGMMMDCDFKLNSNTGFHAKSCCSEIDFIINGNTIKQEEDVLFKAFEFSDVIVLDDSYNIKLYNYTTSKIFFNDYSPPIFLKNINILYQRFII